MKILRLVLVALTAVLIASSAVGCAAPAAQGFAGIASDGEFLYVGSADGQIVALDPTARAAGEPFPASDEWAYPITTLVRGTFGCGTSEVASTLYATPVLSDGHICVGTYDGKVLMLDPEARTSGMIFPQLRAGEWMFPRTDDEIGPIVGDPTIYDDQVFVSSSIADGSRSHGVVYALDRTYGDELWVSDTLDGKLWVTPSVADGVVYVSTFEGHIYSLDAETGRTLPWVYESEVGFVSSPVIFGDVLYVGSFNRSLIAVPLGAESVAWEFQADNWFWATPLVVDDVVYASSLDGMLYALDRDSGAPVWVEPYDTDDSIAGSPVLADDSVVVVSQRGDVHVVDRSSGMGARVPNPTSERASTCNAEVVASPYYLDDLVYVRAQNNVLYAIDPVARSIAYSFSLDME